MCEITNGRILEEKFIQDTFEAAMDSVRLQVLCSWNN